MIEFIGPGVVGFQAWFLDAKEPNRESLDLPGRFGDYRFDFVVRRVDGTAHVDLFTGEFPWLVPHGPAMPLAAGPEAGQASDTQVAARGGGGYASGADARSPSRTSPTNAVGQRTGHNAPLWGKFKGTTTTPHRIRGGPYFNDA